MTGTPPRRPPGKNSARKPPPKPPVPEPPDRVAAIIGWFRSKWYFALPISLVIAIGATAGIYATVTGDPIISIFAGSSEGPSPQPDLPQSPTTSPTTSPASATTSPTTAPSTFSAAPPAANPNVASGVIAWARAQAGSTAYQGFALQFASDAYSKGAGVDLPVGGSSDSYAFWKDHNAEAGDVFLTPAPGALVFWGPTSANPSGYVAISLGDGSAIGADERTVTTIHTFVIADRDQDGYPYLGWIDFTG